MDCSCTESSLGRALGQEDVARLAFIWDGKRCTYNGETDPVKPGKPIAFKELRRLWESKDVAGLFGPSNTLMIDDSRYKASLNPPHTAIHPPAWDDPDAHASDDALGPSGNVRLYLQALLNSEVSVPDFVSATPFEAFQGARAATRLVSDASAMLDEGNSVRESESCAPLNEEDEDGEDEIVLAPGVSR
ncbi:hypothetical protein NSK_002144 [Nannochloropsis salina CCMP1776]|uniref:FCP1 homology domain-containing protein n=1 Tax=Nannochloropsis salina CCMP1776 TaxID=1027361 RepID=A0A4D9D7Z3_9STRA|nr:hypothetical protein NSK_002144 [Nannochloropsis salina CCMP1776]|eukprot:TFJ86487.1 hypothetical protein NSK_002144 [Nannochloropsis salina CCMP1776]